MVYSRFRLSWQRYRERLRRKKIIFPLSIVFISVELGRYDRRKCPPVRRRCSTNIFLLNK